MDFKKLEKNIVDVIKEEQIKLGYRSENVRIYYPLLSLKRLLGVECGMEQMQEYLKQFVSAVSDIYGLIEVSNVKDRFCFNIPAQGSDYIHAHIRENEFLVEFINTVRRHGCTLEEVLQVFQRHSDKVCVEKANHGEFDYLVYFQDGVPDDYQYCLTIEGEHIIYHRFTKEDYQDFHFNT